MQHPAVKQPPWRQRPIRCVATKSVALLVLHENLEASQQAGVPEDIVRWCLSRLAYYKAPGWVALVDALPLTGTQKIQRAALKDLVAEIVAQERCFDMRSMKKRAL